MVTLNELRAASDFLVASGETAAIELSVRRRDGTPLGEKELEVLRSGLAKAAVPAARRQVKDVQNAVVGCEVPAGKLVVRLYAYGRLSWSGTNGRTAGGHFELKILALVRSLVEEAERLGEEWHVVATAAWHPGSALELGDVDPVISTDVAAIDRRVHRIEVRRQRLKRSSAGATLAAAVLAILAGLWLVSGDAARFSLLIFLYAGAALAFGVWARAEAGSLFKDIEAIRGQQDLDGMLSDSAEHERRAMKMFQVHSQQLKRYYDQALRQRGFIFFTGIFCIVAGFSVIAMAFFLLSSATPASSLEKILVAALGAIGGILGNFIAVVYLRMFTQTVKSIGTFHDRLVATHHLHFANFLVSKVANSTGRDDAFRLVAEIAAAQDGKARNGTFLVGTARSALLSWWANATAGALSRSPAFVNRWFTWVFTVASLTTSVRAISVFDRPVAISRSTSISRAVRPSISFTRAGFERVAASTSRRCSSPSTVDCPAAADWRARTMASASASFVRNPRAPARRAASSDSSSAYVVSTTTSVSGYPARTRSVVSTPSQRGIRRSTSSTSGRCSATSSSAASPSAAAPTTSTPGSRPSSVTRPSRTTAWSSARTTRRFTPAPSGESAIRPPPARCRTARRAARSVHSSRANRSLPPAVRVAGGPAVRSRSARRTRPCSRG